MTEEEFYEHVEAGNFTEEVFRCMAKEWHPTLYMRPKGYWTEEEIFDNLKSGRWRVEDNPQPPQYSGSPYGRSPWGGPWSIYVEGCAGF